MGADGSNSTVLLLSAFSAIFELTFFKSPTAAIPEPLAVIFMDAKNKQLQQMTNFDIPHFGQIDLALLEEYYSIKIEWKGSFLRLDLNFESKQITQEQAKIIKAFLDNIDSFQIRNKLIIDKYFIEEGETADYINFYLDELDEEELSNIVDNNDKQNSTKNQLLDKLKLIRVGLYPDGKYGADYYGVFDYSIDIDGEPCNQLLVVKTNETGNLDHITWES